MPRKSAISMGAYTWWVKDWQADSMVFELNLIERGAYRELIDMAMINDNKVHANLKSLARRWNEDTRVVRNLMTRLDECGLIEWDEENNTLSVPSCEKRLVAIRSGKRGGKASGKGKGKGRGQDRGYHKDKDKDKDKEITTDVVKERATPKTSSPDSILHISELSKRINNKRTLSVIIKSKYNGTFDDFETEDAKLNAFRHAIKDFNAHLVATADELKTQKDYAGHLHNWLRTERERNRYKVFPWQLYLHGANGRRAVTKDGQYIVRKDLKVER